MSTTSHTPALPPARRATRGSDSGMWAVVSLLLGLLNVCNVKGTMSH
jgi:hypothetical protein